MGVHPNTGLAEEAGLAFGAMGGILVDEFAQTCDPDVYAAGDVVEYPNTFLGEPMRIPLAGRIAGEHAAWISASRLEAPAMQSDYLTDRA